MSVAGRGRRGVDKGCTGKVPSELPYLTIVGAAPAGSSRESPSPRNPKPMRKLLVVTSKPMDPGVEATLRKGDWELCPVASASAAQAATAQEDFLVGLAVVWPDTGMRETTELAELVQRSRTVRWVVAIDRRRIDQLESCLALAAESLWDYFSLPLDPQRVAVILGHAYGMAEVESRFLAGQRTHDLGRLGMIGDSAPMHALASQISRAASCDVPVVLVGETGTGKELVARAIHESSVRAQGPFVAVNCAAIPATLIQAELFGYEKGAFTGAVESRPGYIESATSGTLFLDEVAELSPEAQSSLLRCLEDGKIVRLGSTKARSVDVRVISATHADLEALVREQRFRLDLFYRLQVLAIRVPSLRERGQDIVTLAQHFLSEFGGHNSTQAIGFSRSALARIEQYDWPGNLRELRNRVHQAALDCTGRYITPADLRLERRSGRRGAVTLQEAREAAELQVIRSALSRNGQNMVQAAKELQVSRMTLYRLMQKHGLDHSG